MYSDVFEAPFLPCVIVADISCLLFEQTEDWHELDMVITAISDIVIS